MIVWDDTIKKEFAIFIWSLFLGFGVVLFYILESFGIPLIWVLFIQFGWYAFDVFIAAYMFHVYKIRKSDVPILTPVKGIPENSTKPEAPLISPT